MSIARRVYARFVRADSIGNVHDFLAQWKKALDKYAGMEAALPKILAAASERFDPSIDGYHRSNFQYFASFSYRLLQRIGIPKLFLALLQQYDLPPAARKKVEDYAKFYAKAHARDPKGFDASVVLFRKLLKTYREQYATTAAIVNTAQPRGTDVDGANILDAGPFKVVNTGGFDQATMEKVARVVREAATRLKAKGLGKVCYGEVLISKRISKANVLAFYMIASDEMFVRADLQGHEKEALKTILHELGHRLRYRFLESAKPQIDAMYRRIKRGHEAAREQVIDEAVNDPSKRPKPGESIIERKKTWVVDAVKDDWSGPKIQVHLQDEPTLKAQIPLVSWLSVKGLISKVPKTHGFITNYASKNSEENFAEMISYLCVNELPDEQAAMLLPIIG